MKKEELEEYLRNHVLVCDRKEEIDKFESLVETQKGAAPAEFHKTESRLISAVKSLSSTRLTSAAETLSTGLYPLEGGVETIMMGRRISADTFTFFIGLSIRFIPTNPYVLFFVPEQVGIVAIQNHGQIKWEWDGQQIFCYGRKYLISDFEKEFMRKVEVFSWCSLLDRK